MIHPHTPSRRASLLSAAISLTVVTSPSFAAVKTWDGAGSDDNWQTGPNWNADTAPLADDQLVFAGTVRLNATNNFTAGTLFNGISFPAAAGTFNLSGNAVTLTRGISAGNGTVSGGTIINSSVNVQNLTLPIHLATGKHVLNSPGSTGGMNFSGAFTRSANSSVVVTRSGGQINVNGSGLANENGILGGWAVIGNDWATINGSGNISAYTGYTFINSGVMASGATLNYRYTDDSTTPVTTAAGTTTINTLSASITEARTITLGGPLKLATKGGIYRAGSSSGTGSTLIITGGSITADGGGEISLWNATSSTANFTATNNTLRIDSPITNDGANPVSLNIVGYLDLRGANTHSGGTFINQGRIQTGNLGVFGTGPVTVYPGGSAFLNNGGSWTSNFFISGVGSTEAGTNNPAGPGAIRLGTTSNITGTVTLQGNARLTSSSNAASGGNTGPTISGRITGTGNLEIVPFANNTAFLNLTNTNLGTPNDWAGSTTVNSINGTRTMTVKLGASEQIPDGSDLTLTGANEAILELNGFNETIGALNGPASVNPRVTNQAVGTTSTFTIGGNNANGDYGGDLEDKILEPVATLNLVKNGTGKQILRGVTNFRGTTTVNGGTLESIGDYLGLGAITVNSGATFAAGGVVSGNVTVADGGRFGATGANFLQTELDGTLSLGSGTALDINTGALPLTPVTVAGAVTASGGAGSVTVNLSVPPGTPPPGIGQHPLLAYDSLSNPAAFVLGTKPNRFEATITNDAVGKVLKLNVTDSGSFPVWKGALGNEWSTATLPAPKNWVLNTNAAITTDFLAGDAVLFNDSATTTTPDISVADVTPSGVTFNNSTKTYTLTGTEGIAGTGPVIKEGTGTAIIATDNSYSGATTINAGTLRVGNGGTSGNLGTGEVINESVLDFNRSDSHTFANLISGGVGEIRHTGSGTTTLSAANIYNGPSILSAGTVRITNSNSLGSLGGGGVIVEAGGSVDLGGATAAGSIDFSQKQFTISGNGPSGDGALVNMGAFTQLNAFERVALDANASVGGTNRWDIRIPTPTAANPNTAKLELGTHTLRKRGINQVTCVAVDITGEAASLIVEQGLLALETTTNTMGTGSIICEPGTYMQFYQTGNVINVDYVGVTWPITLREGCAIGSANGTPSTVTSPVILEGNATVVPLNAGAPSPASVYPLVLNGTITENGGSYSLTKSGVSSVTLNATGSSYTGATQVTEGSLIVNGSITASPVTVATGATLGGTGTTGGTVAANGILSPGMAVIGTFNTGATTFSGTGSLAAQINSGTLTSDVLAVTGSLNLGGATLTVTDLGAATLTAGSKFTIATHTGGVTGAFLNAPDGGNITVGPNTFKIDYDESVLGQTAITLTVAAGSAYDDWATLKGLNGTNNGKLADPDGDGLANIVEFGLDQEPLQAGSNGKLRSALADVDPGAGVENAFTLTVAMRTGASFTGSTPGDLLSQPVDGAIYRVEGSATLNGFPLDITEVTPALSTDMPTPSTGWSYRSFRLPGTPGNPNLKAFLRVDVAPQNP